MNDSEIKLSTTLVNSILQYLATKPFQEVFQFIEAIQKEGNPQLAALAAKQETKK
jgi:hypothetical protein